MKKYLVISFLVVGLVLGRVALAYDRGYKVNFTLGIGKLSGNTTYQIGGTANISGLGSQELHFPVSELEFPLDVYMVSMGGNIAFAEKWKMSVDVGKNITSDAGKLKDSDWGVYWLEGMPGAEQDTLDIYSESDANLDALIININLQYRFYESPNWSFSAGLGYMGENFDYEVSNLDQWYPSSTYYFGYDLGHEYVSGKVITYTVKYSIPYMEASVRCVKDKFRFEASLGYSPVVKVIDEDHHILRNKVCKGDCNGNATLFFLEGDYEFRKFWLLTIRLSYVGIDTSGKQTQYLEGELFGTIDEKIKSEQTSIVFGVKHSF